MFELIAPGAVVAAIVAVVVVVVVAVVVAAANPGVLNGAFPVVVVPAAKEYGLTVVVAAGIAWFLNFLLCDGTAVPGAGADDGPLSQILQILDEHHVSLRWIDQHSGEMIRGF